MKRKRPVETKEEEKVISRVVEKKQRGTEESEEVEEVLEKGAVREEQLNDTQKMVLEDVLEDIKEKIVQNISNEPAALFLVCNAMGVNAGYAEFSKDFLGCLDKLGNPELSVALYRLYTLIYLPQESKDMEYLRKYNTLGEDVLCRLVKEQAIFFFLDPFVEAYREDESISDPIKKLMEDLPEIFSGGEIKESVDMFLKLQAQIKPDASWRQWEENKEKDQQIAAAIAADEEVARRLQEEFSMESTDFLQEVYLNRALFEGRNLSETDFTKSLVQNAKFLHCTLDEAIFEEANLQRTEFFTGSAKGAYFNNADLRGSRFTAVDLTGADFLEAKTQGAIFDASSLKSLCNGREEDGELSLQEIVIAETDGVKDLRGINLSFVDLSGVDLRGAVLKGHDFKETVVDGAKFDRAAFESLLADGSGKRIYLQGANCAEADFSGLDLSRFNLNNADLRNTNLQEANLEGTGLDNAKMQGAVRGAFTASLQQPVESKAREI